MKHLDKVIVLSLLLGTLSMPQPSEAAPISSGTHTISGTYDGGGGLVVYATSPVTLNAVGDVVMTSNTTPERPAGGVDSAVPIQNNGQPLDINMNNHNLTVNSNWITILGDIGSTTNITGANNVVLNVNRTMGANTALRIRAGGTFTMEANSLEAYNLGTKTTPAGIFADGGNITLNLGSGGLKVESGNYALVAQGGGNVNVISGGAADISSTNSAAIVAVGGTINLKTKDDITVKQSSEYSGLNSGHLSLVSTSGNVKVVSAGIFMNVRAASTLSIDAAKDVNIHSAGRVFNERDAGAVVSIKSNGNVNLISDNEMALRIGDGAVFEVVKSQGGLIQSPTIGIDAFNGAKVNLYAGTIKAPLAISATGGSQVDGTSAAGINRAIEGEILADGTNSTVKYWFDTPSSYFTGFTTETNGGKTELSFWNPAIWNLTNNSVIDKLALNGGKLNMNYTGAGKYETVRAQNMTGSGGHILLTTDLQSSKDTMNVQADSDRIKIVDASAGNYIVDIADASIINNTIAEGYLLLIEDCYYPGKSYSNMATFTGGDLVKGGLFRYMPIITNEDPAATSGYTGVTTDVRPAGCGASAPPCANTNHLWTKNSWYLMTSTKQIDPYTGNPVLEPSAKPHIGSSAARYVSYWRELDTMLHRLGDLRNTDTEDGVWVRYKHGKETVGGMLKDSTFSMGQIGYDKQVTNTATDGKRFRGLAYNHTWGDQNYEDGATGTTSANALSFYDAWMGPKGHYLDLVAKVGRLQRDFQYYGDNYIFLDESADNSATFYSLSAEYGRKAKSANGWYVEPQGQFTLGHVASSSYTSSQGTEVYNGAVNSAVLRVGSTFGREVGGKDGKTNVYAKAFWNHEFGGDLDLDLRDVYKDEFSSSESYSGSWWTLGLGTTVQLDKKTNIYFDLEKTYQGKFDTNWQFNVGARWSF